jgi:hypothetical protein
MQTDRMTLRVLMFVARFAIAMITKPMKVLQRERWRVVH